LALCIRNIVDEGCVVPPLHFFINRRFAGRWADTLIQLLSQDALGFLLLSRHSGPTKLS